MSHTIKVIWPASPRDESDLTLKLAPLEKQGFNCIFETPLLARWPFATGDIAPRAKALNEALLSERVDYILVAKGGYGCSDLLPYIQWQELAKKPQNKTLIGFSDASALIAALWTKLQWQSIHGPMPQSDLWQVQDESGATVLMKMLIHSQSAEPLIFKTAYNLKQNSLIKGEVFGGCLSVLTQLIGTPYFPKFHRETILFWEDVGESAAKIMRLVNQWLQAGCLENVSSIILGRFTKIDPSGDLTRQDEIELLVQQELASRLKLPIFICENLGHVVENHPIFVGKHAEIRNMKLNYVHRNVESLV